MKINSLASLFLALLAMCLTWSCTSKNGDLYDVVANDNAVIMTGSAKTIIENAGCTVKNNEIELSATLERLIGSLSSRDRKEIHEVLDIEGVDLGNCIFAAEKEGGVFAFKITDMGKFKDYVDDLSDGEAELKEERGVCYYKLGYSTKLFIRDNVGCVLMRNSKTSVSDFEDYLDHAKKNPLPSWQRSALDEGNALNMLVSMEQISNMVKQEAGIDIFSSPLIAMAYDPEEISDGFVKINCDLDGVVFTTKGQITNNAGKALTSKLAGDKVDASLLKYASAKDIAVAMVALPKDIDWNQLLGDLIDMMGGPRTLGVDKTTLSIVSAVLDNIDGSVMLAAGPDKVMQIDHIRGWHGVLAAEMKDKKAAEYIDMIKEWIDKTNADTRDRIKEYAEYGWTDYQPSLIEYTYADGTLKVTVPGEGEIYAAANGNNFVVSLSPISTDGGCAISAGTFRGMCGGIVIDLPKDNVFSTVMSFPFGVYMQYLTDGTTLTFKAEETDAKGLFISNIIDFAAGMVR